MAFEKIITLLVIFCSSIIYPRDLDQDSLHYLQIPYSSKELTIDGNLSDWGNCFNYHFEDTLTSFKTTGDFDLKDIYPPEFDFSEMKLPRSKNKVLVRSFWNMNYLYFGITVFDANLFAEIASRVDKPRIHMNDGIEIYIDTKNDSHAKMDINDYQFIVDVKSESVVFRGDRKEIIADTLAVPKDYDQNILFQASVMCIGTLNDETNIDSLYVIEIGIPFAAIGLIPQTGDKMRLDICVNDIDYFENEGIEIEEISSNDWTFDWSGYSDFGYPKYWKKIKLIGKPSFFENLSEKYKKEWIWIYALTLFISILIITLLIYRAYKLKQLPTHSETDKYHININQKINDKISLSYNQNILQEVSEYIISRRKEVISSEEVANHISVSLRTLQRITKGELNITPTNYIYIVKLKLASEFLKNKAGNVTDATYEFGFSDPSYFSKMFKKHFGIAPSEYKKSSA